MKYENNDDRGSLHKHILIEGEKCVNICSLVLGNGDNILLCLILSVSDSRKYD